MAAATAAVTAATVRATDTAAAMAATTAAILGRFSLFFSSFLIQKHDQQINIINTELCIDNQSNISNTNILITSFRRAGCADCLQSR